MSRCKDMGAAILFTKSAQLGVQYFYHDYKALTLMRVLLVNVIDRFRVETSPYT